MENVEPDQNYDGLSNVNVYNQVVVPSLETLNNKRIYSEGLVTVENLMTNSSTNQGITKESTLNFDLYVPEVRFKTITNNNVDYKLSQLTQDQSDYFSKNSIIKANITPTKKQISISNFYLNISNPTWFNGAIPVTPTSGFNQIRFTKLPATGTDNWGIWNFYILLGYNENGRLCLIFYQPGANHSNVNWFRNCYYFNTHSTLNQINWVKIKYNNEDFIICGIRDQVDDSGFDNMSMIFLDDWEITNF